MVDNVTLQIAAGALAIGAVLYFIHFLDERRWRKDREAERQALATPAE